MFADMETCCESPEAIGRPPPRGYLGVTLIDTQWGAGPLALWGKNPPGFQRLTVSLVSGLALRMVSSHHRQLAGTCPGRERNGAGTPAPSPPPLLPASIVCSI